MPSLLSVRVRSPENMAPFASIGPRRPGLQPRRSNDPYTCRASSTTTAGTYCSHIQRPPIRPPRLSIDTRSKCYRITYTTATRTLMGMADKACKRCTPSPIQLPFGHVSTGYYALPVCASGMETTNRKAPEFHGQYGSRSTARTGGMQYTRPCHDLEARTRS